MSHLSPHLLHDDARHLVAPLVISAQLLQDVPRVRQEPSRQGPPATPETVPFARRESAAKTSAVNALKLTLL